LKMIFYDENLKLLIVLIFLFVVTDKCHSLLLKRRLHL
jgi:hypothetical protein